jgi:hypothetical protein
MNLVWVPSGAREIGLELRRRHAPWTFLKIEGREIRLDGNQSQRLVLSFCKIMQLLLKWNFSAVAALCL